jgi:hypothetical protein
MRTIVRFRSYYSPNKFVCHPEHKKNCIGTRVGTNSYYRPNKILLYLEQLIIIVNKFTPHLKQTNI